MWLQWYDVALPLLVTDWCWIIEKWINNKFLVCQWIFNCQCCALQISGSVSGQHAGEMYLVHGGPGSVDSDGLGLTHTIRASPATVCIHVKIYVHVCVHIFMYMLVFHGSTNIVSCYCLISCSKCSWPLWRTEACGLSHCQYSSWCWNC